PFRALGVMVSVMLTGRLPFDAAPPWEWATKHLTAEPTPMDAHPAGAHVPPAKKAAVMRALAKDREARQSSVLAFLQEFTGYQDADVAWTMATSAGGGILPKAGGAPAARAPAPTPAPGWGGPTPPPNAAPSHVGMGSHPGMVSHPGYGSTPGLTPAPGYGSLPGNGAPSYGGQSYPGHSYPGYNTGPQPAATGGGLMGKLLAVGLVALFVLAGGAGGLAWYLNQEDDSGAVT